MIPITTEQRTAIVRLTKQGKSAPEIAVLLGIHARTVHRVRTRLNINVRPATIPFTDDELCIARSMLDDGCSYGEVARTLGRSHRQLQKLFPGYGWPQSRGAEARRLKQELDICTSIYGVAK